MTDTVDLASLLSSSEGIIALQQGGNKFGVRVFAMESKVSNCVDFGSTTASDWSPQFPVPKGYEQLQEKQSSVLNQMITISHEEFDSTPVIISDIQVLPRDTIGRPVFKLTDSNDESNESAKGKSISAGHSIRLNLQCIIPSGFEGFLGR